MRVPISIVIPLCAITIAVTWWRGTRDYDFLTPPSEDKLAEIRARVEASIPSPDQPGSTVISPVADAPPPTDTPPPPHTNPTQSPPSLDDYRDLASQGAAYLVDLAVLHESQDRNQRALLAWERVLDSANPNAKHAEEAVAAIARLRPTLPDWHATPARLSLHAGTSTDSSEILLPALEQIAAEIQNASAGLLNVTPRLSTGDAEPSDAPPTVALWLSGTGENPKSTEVFSFTLTSPETAASSLRLTTYQLIRSYLRHATDLTPPMPLPKHADTSSPFATRVTRLAWRELGRHLDPDSNRSNRSNR